MLKGDFACHGDTELIEQRAARAGALLNLIEADMKVVQLIPVKTVYDEEVEPAQLCWS